MFISRKIRWLVTQPEILEVGSAFVIVAISAQII